MLVISSLTNVTGYSIDQGDLEMANFYFRCVRAAMEKYVKGRQGNLSEHQMGVLRSRPCRTPETRMNTGGLG